MRICNKCQEPREEELFTFRDKSKGIKKEICKICNKEYHDNYYKENKDKEIKRLVEANKLTRLRNRNFIAYYLKTHPCVDCGEGDLRVLDFDHVKGDKINHVSKMVANCFAVSKLLQEIEKCEVRCANCHRKKTFTQSGWNTPKMLDSYK